MYDESSFRTFEAASITLLRALSRDSIRLTDFGSSDEDEVGAEAWASTRGSWLPSFKLTSSFSSDSTRRFPLISDSSSVRLVKRTVRLPTWLGPTFWSEPKVSIASVRRCWALRYRKGTDDVRCLDSLCRANLSTDELTSPSISLGSSFLDPLTRNVIVVAGFASLKIPHCYISVIFPEQMETYNV